MQESKNCQSNETIEALDNIVRSLKDKVTSFMDKTFKKTEPVAQEPQQQKPQMMSVEEYYKEILDLETWKKKFIEFYGEKYAKKIEELFKKCEFTLLPQYLRVYEFKKFLNEKYPNLIQTNMAHFSWFKSAVEGALQGDQIMMKSLVKESKILKDLGMEEAVSYNEESGTYSFNPEYIQKVKAVAKDLDVAWKSTGVEVDWHKSIGVYEDNFVRDKAIGFLEIGTGYGGEFAKACSRMLNESDEEFFKELGDIFKPMTPIDNIPDNATYQVGVINKLLGTEYKDWKDFKENCSESAYIIDLLKQRQEQLKYNESLTNEQTRFVNELMKKFVEEGKYQSGSEAKYHFMEEYHALPRDEDTAAYLNLGDEKHIKICIPINEYLSLNLILHEINHLVQMHKGKERPFETGFNEKGEIAEKFDRNETNYKYCYLNEIVNEYLTNELVNDCFGDVKFPLSENEFESLYQRGISLFKPFLDKYKEVLKKSVICDNPMVFRDKILGDKNFDKLADLMNTYLAADERLYLRELTEKLGKPVDSFEDVLRYSNEISTIEMSGNLSRYVTSVVEGHKLSLLLADNYTKFMSGEKVDLTSKLGNAKTNDTVVNV